MLNVPNGGLTRHKKSPEAEGEFDNYIPGVAHYVSAYGVAHLPITKQITDRDIYYKTATQGVLYLPTKPYSDRMHTVPGAAITPLYGIRLTAS